jgi:hypothetical protein
VETVKQTSKKFELIDGILYRNQSIVVPDSKLIDPRTRNHVETRTFLVRYYHEAGPFASHRGEVQTKASLRRLFWFPAMDVLVQRWTKSCPTCQLRRAQQSKDYHPRITTGPNQLLIVDWTGPIRGEYYVIIMVDAFSMFCVMLPFTQKNSENTCEAILTWSSLLGTPQFWTSDNDSTFVSQVSRELREIMGIRDITVPAYSPCTQGSVENKVKSLKEAVEFFSDEVISLTTLLRCMAWGFNATVKYGTGLTPFEVMLGRQPMDFLAVALQGSGSESHDSLSDYVQKLQTKLRDIHTYWASKTLDVRSRNIDYVADPSPEFAVGDNCIRVIYTNGRRECLDLVQIVEKIPNSHNLYLVRNDTETNIKVNGYQLVKLNDDSIRDQFDVSHRSALINSSVGTMVAVRSGPDIYFGITVAPYTGERLIELQFVIPLDNRGRFRFPSTSSERETYTEMIDTSIILRVGVTYEPTSTPREFTIVLSQFGGRVAS